MQHPQSHILMLLTLMGLGLMTTSPALADGSEGVSGLRFLKGPMGTCVVSAEVAYPCVFLTPPGYQPHPGSMISATAVGPKLPLDGDADPQDTLWLEKLKNGDILNSRWQLAPQLRGMNMDFSLDQSGAEINMDMGPMKLNIFSEDGRLSDSRVFLLIERSW